MLKIQSKNITHHPVIPQSTVVKTVEHFLQVLFFWAHAHVEYSLTISYRQFCILLFLLEIITEGFSHVISFDSVPCTNPLPFPPSSLAEECVACTS